MYAFEYAVVYLYCVVMADAAKDLPCRRAASVLPSVKQSLQDRTDIWSNVTI